jgi:hypothetical protein
MSISAHLNKRKINLLSFRKEESMWRELIHSLEPHAQYAPGASEAQIAELCGAFSLVLSEDLRTLLKESNGVQDPSGFCIIWSTEKISQYNREMRTFPHYSDFYQPFTDLLFFADAGNGDRFAFPIVQGEVQSGPVIAWDHEDDTRKDVVSSLKSYLESWLSGEMSV